MWLKLKSRTGKDMLVDMSKITHVVKIKTGTELHGAVGPTAALEDAKQAPIVVQETLEAIAARVKAKAT
jgi:hypothetical protein